MAVHFVRGQLDIDTGIVTWRSSPEQGDLMHTTTLAHRPACYTRLFVPERTGGHAQAENIERTQCDPSKSSNCYNVSFLPPSLPIGGILGEIVSLIDISLGVLAGTGQDVGIKRLEYRYLRNEYWNRKCGARLCKFYQRKKVYVEKFQFKRVDYLHVNGGLIRNTQLYPRALLGSLRA